jgi:hypothetical protein
MRPNIDASGRRRWSSRGRRREFLLSFGEEALDGYIGGVAEAEDAEEREGC